MKLNILHFLLFLTLSITAKSQSSTPNYLIQRGDLLDIAVMDHPEFSMQNVAVLPDGFIQYPALGSVQVAGMSSQSLTDSLKNCLQRYVVNPMVTVFIRRIQNQMVNIYGYVNNPGQFQIYEGIDLYSAIGMAGGLVAFKSVNKIRIIRANKSLEEVNVHQLFNPNNKNEISVMVYPGDTIYILEPHEINWQVMNFIMSVILLAVTTTTIFIR